MRGAPLLLALASLPLVACGFHPRGSVGSAAEVGRLFVDVDRNLSIEEALRAALRERAFVIVDDRDAADVVLRVADERQSQRIVSVRSTGRVSEFELGHSVEMLIARPLDTAAGATGGGVASAPSADGPAVVDRVAAADRVEVTREYTYDESLVLGKENEARILRSEMSEELVRQVVLRTIASLARQDPPAAGAEPPSPAPQ